MAKAVSASRLLQAIAERLLIYHLGEPASHGVQVVVGALLDDSALIQDEYHVAVSDGGQPMGD